MDAGVGGDTEIGCRVESGIAEGCRASGRGGRRREEVRVEQFTKSMIEVEVIDGRSIDHVGEGLFGWRVVRAVREAGGNVDVACANERGRDVAELETVAVLAGLRILAVRPVLALLPGGTGTTTAAASFFTGK